MADEAVEFLRRFHPGGPWAVSAICPDTGRIENRCFTRPQAEHMRRWLAERVESRNLYFSVGRPDHVCDTRLSESDVAFVDWLHADIDPGDGRDLERIRADVDEWHYDLPKPTVVLCSGNGLQVFWRLADTFRPDGDPSPVKDRNRHVANALGGDSTPDLGRLMRLPGTRNLPNEKKRRLGRVACDTYLIEFNDTTHALDNFEKAEPGGGVPAAGPAAVAPSPGEATYTLENLRNAKPCAITELDIPDRAKEIALHGRTDTDPPDDTSRSGWLFSLLTTCSRAGVPAGSMASLLKSDELHESLRKHVDENGGDRYMHRQIERALEKAPQVSGDGTVAFSEDHLAVTFARAHEDDLRYCALVGKWFHWTGSRWELVRQLLDGSRTRTGPGLYIDASRCPHLVETLPEAPRAPYRAEDVDPRWDRDHWLDALVYGCRAIYDNYRVASGPGGHIGMF